MPVPLRLGFVTISLWRGPVELPWSTCVELLDEIGRLDDAHHVVQVFDAAGASAPVRLGTNEKDLVAKAIDRWVTDVGADELPDGVWDLRCALVDELASLS
jgi:hypothetical protein